MSPDGVRQSPVPETGAAALRTATHLPSLDGWRALSIILVLGAHCKYAADFPEALAAPFEWLFDGGLGVRIFFVISGLLITWLMLLEHHRTGRLSLRRFYARRALRILPVYAALLVVIALAQYLTDFHQSRAIWFGSLTFTSNWIREGNWVTGHLWSLAIEEQFYLLWPTCFVLFEIAKSRGRLLALLLIPVCIAPISRVVTYTKIAPDFMARLFVPASFLNFFDSLAIGCACAVLMFHSKESTRKWVSARPRTLLIGGLGLVAVPYFLSRWFTAGFLTVPFGNSLQGVGIALLILQSVVLPSFGFYGIFNKPAVSLVGVWSYSIYIWQQVILTGPELFGVGNVWWLTFPYWLAPTIAVAVASYYGIERPLFRLRDKIRRG